ncbi:hypothetical protein OOK31_35305 [Streptomyces sp. NBC_00249]|uniref:hypothetical protein n=1 Tax=Streptomyces sp. NBC_00249 TaxID=2975690 RepID=UPI002251CBAA|nr:hypothetical protein [Streptomyces sp. NBC_00249]MCX5199095.1 hypothetical protein [Streptomyces sp. NBC_00249]
MPLLRPLPRSRPPAPAPGGPRIVDTVLRNLLAYGVLVAALLAMAGGKPHHYEAGPVPAVHDADITEIIGTWRCVDGTEVVFRADGSASVTLLDGQERDYAAGWRLSGPARWRLTDGPGQGLGRGQHLRLDLPAATGTASRAGTVTKAPGRYTWTFELRRDARKTLELYFFLANGTGSGPGRRGSYVLEKDA